MPFYIPLAVGKTEGVLVEIVGSGELFCSEVDKASFHEARMEREYFISLWRVRGEEDFCLFPYISLPDWEIYHVMR